MKSVSRHASFRTSPTRHPQEARSLDNRKEFWPFCSFWPLGTRVRPFGLDQTTQSQQMRPKILRIFPVPQVSQDPNKVPSSVWIVIFVIIAVASALVR